MTQARALPSPGVPPAAAGEVLSKLEALARRELTVLQAAASPCLTAPIDPALACLAWDLGLDAQQLA